MKKPGINYIVFTFQSNAPDWKFMVCFDYEIMVTFPPPKVCLGTTWGRKFHEPRNPAGSEKEPPTPQLRVLSLWQPWTLDSDVPYQWGKSPITSFLQVNFYMCLYMCVRRTQISTGPPSEPWGYLARRLWQ